MATVIRLSRGGRRKLPFYHIIVTDKRNARDGHRIEQLGHYDPLSTENEGHGKWVFDKERAAYWLSQGAQPSERLERIFLKEGLGSDKQRQKWENRFDRRKAIISKRVEDKKAAEAAEKAAEEAEAKKAADEAAAAEAAEAAAAEAPAEAEAEKPAE